jgi:nitrous oxidase accessory protein NosD
MASTYSTLKIELIGTGEQQGTWGSTTNVNLGTALEEAIVGRATANFTSDANLTLTLTNSNATQVARNLVLNVTSGVSLTVTRDLIVPAIEKPYIIQNNTTGAQSIRVIVAGTGVTVPNGKTAIVYNDGTDVKYAFDHVGALDVGGMPR